MNTQSPYSRISSFQDSSTFNVDDEDPLNNTMQLTNDESSQISDGMKDTSHGRIYLDKSCDSDGMLDDHFDLDEEPLPFKQKLLKFLFPKCTWKLFVESFSLYLITFFMVLMRSIDFVLYIRLATKMRNYEFILSGFLLSFAFNLISWPIVLFHTFVTGKIDKRQWKFPIYHFICMGLLDFTNNVMSTAVAPYLSGPINVTLGQSVILHNMVSSFFFLRARFTIFHYIGVLLVGVGIVVDVIPLFLHSGSDQPIVPPAIAAIFVIIGLASYIPMSFSNVYKENYLKKADLNEWFVNAWIALFQLIFGILFFPSVFIPLPNAPHIKITEFGTYLKNGFKCLVGINSHTYLNSENLDEVDRCDGTWALFLVFICFNITYNLLMLTTMKRGSSTLAMVASSGRLAMSNILFLVPFIAGIATSKSLSPYDIAALFILIIGIAFYGIRREKLAKDEDIFVRITHRIFPCLRKKNKTNSIDESIQGITNDDYLETHYKNNTQGKYDSLEDF